MTRSLIILGTGGSVHDVLDIVEAVNAITPTWRVTGFLDDAWEPGKGRLGYAVLGTLREAGGFDDCWFLNAIGSPGTHRQRESIVQSTGLAPERFATLVHPQASVSSRAHLAHGVYVAAGASVAGGVQVGEHATIGPGAIVGHDSIIEAYAILAPAAVVSGFVRVGHSAYLGANSVIRQGLDVGEKALVGIGAVAVRNVDDGSVVVGNPARRLDR